MENKEKIINLWFDMWIQKKDLGIAEIFSKDIAYTESWGPKYIGVNKIKYWFDEWNTRGTVLEWKIKQYFHEENKTIVEWFFKCKMNDEIIHGFDGISLVEWTNTGLIQFLKEFKCNVDNYDPYKTLHYDADNLSLV